MAHVSANANLESIERSECVQLLRQFSIGRIAIDRDGAPPLVVPVNYAVDEDVIVFRSDPGTKIATIHRSHVSFQIDFIDPYHRTGWSVLVCGTASEATATQVEHVGVESWAEGDKAHWIRIEPDAISGRRIRLPEVELDGRGYL